MADQRAAPTQAVAAAIQQLNEDIAAGLLPGVAGLQSADGVAIYRLRASCFDDSTPGGRQIMQDLNKLLNMYGRDYVEIEIAFPMQYPEAPCGMRVVSPRMQLYTGHVTAGGSIVLRMLAPGSEGGTWDPSWRLCEVVASVLAAMANAAVGNIDPATVKGPGGASGPLRVDFDHVDPSTGLPSPLSGYGGRGRAQETFRRAVGYRQQHGWGDAAGWEEFGGQQVSSLREARAAGAGGRRAWVAAARAWWRRAAARAAALGDGGATLLALALAVLLALALHCLSVLRLQQGQQQQGAQLGLPAY